MGYPGYRFSDEEIDKIINVKQRCDSAHPWWPGVHCELKPDHRSDMCEAKLDGAGHPGAKIKWKREEGK